MLCFDFFLFILFFINFFWLTFIFYSFVDSFWGLCFVLFNICSKTSSCCVWQMFYMFLETVVVVCLDLYFLYVFVFLIDLYILQLFFFFLLCDCSVILGFRVCFILFSGLIIFPKNIILILLFVLGFWIFICFVLGYVFNSFSFRVSWYFLMLVALLTLCCIDLVLYLRCLTFIFYFCFSSFS